MAIIAVFWLFSFYEDVGEPIYGVSFSRFHTDELGLDWVDRKILEVIIDKFNGGPVGLSAIAASTAEDIATVEEVYEPYLMQLGFLDRTPRGRVATDAAYAHLGRKKKGQEKLV